MRLRGQQLIEGQFRVTADPDADHLQPESRHRLVVAFGAAVVGGEMPDPARDIVGCPFEAEAADLDPGQPKVIPVMETLVGKLVSVKSCYKRFIGRRDAR